MPPGTGIPGAPRIGRWEVAADGDVVLVGSHCARCGENFFPERAVCSRCGSVAIDGIRLAGPARLTSYTFVHQVPAGFASPVIIGYGKLAGDVIVLAPIDAEPGAVHTGMSLRLHEGVTSMADDGTPFHTYRFRPMSS
jgi:uncharacterized OB-fold protein